jgi:protein-L-isoaspartate(D-aspartate) O-methyltransferase
MHWEYVLSGEDYDLYRRNIASLEEQVVNHFSDSYKIPEILSAIRSVPRHMFVHESYRYMAYTDNALPSSGHCTTSAPSVIALMIACVGIRRGQKLLEIGTGTGYEAAVLSEMGVHVFSIEIDGYLARRANRILTQLGYKSDKTRQSSGTDKRNDSRFQALHSFFPHRGPVRLFLGNGRLGLERFGPYRGMIVAASVPALRAVDRLAVQLSDRGLLVVPAGERHDQALMIIKRNDHAFHTSRLEGYSFDFVRLILDKTAQ